MDDEISSLSTAISELVCPTGTDSEMVRIAGAELSLMDRDQSAIVIRSGEFAVRIIKQLISPLALAVCMVGDHQWPVGKDSPVLRLGRRRFSFALSGFFYGLLLPASCPEDVLKRLERILMKLCAYEDYPNFRIPEAETNFWPSPLPDIENLTNQMLQKIVLDHPKPSLWTQNPDNVSNKAMRAMRMSAVVKLVSKALLRGAIDLYLHTDVDSPTPAISSKKENKVRAFASIRAFADLVDAVETAGRSIATTGGDRPRGSLNTNFRYWNFNQSGLILLLRAAAATAVVHVIRNSKPGEAGSSGQFVRPVTELSGDSCLTQSSNL